MLPVKKGWISLITYYRSADLAAVVDLFYLAVHAIDSKFYSKDELEAWAAVDEKKHRMISWREKLKAPYTFLAKMDAQVVGFAHSTETGYLDLLYVHPDYQRRGVAKDLVDMVEKALAQSGVEKIETDASIAAKAFFTARGYQVVKKQKIVRRNEQLINYKMIKDL